MLLLSHQSVYLLDNLMHTLASQRKKGFMPNIATVPHLPVDIEPQQIDAAAKMISTIIDTSDPCAGYNLRGLLSIYFANPDARIKINQLVSAVERAAEYRLGKTLRPK